jgi:hypothetical protein
MNDTHRFLLSVCAGIVAYVVVYGAYYLDGREPNRALVGATGAIAAVGAWHFLRYRKKS